MMAAVCRLPSAVCRLPSAVCRLPKAYQQEVGPAYSLLELRDFVTTVRDCELNKCRIFWHVCCNVYDTCPAVHASARAHVTSTWRFHSRILRVHGLNANQHHRKPERFSPQPQKNGPLRVGAEWGKLETRIRDLIKHKRHRSLGIVASNGKRCSGARPEPKANSDVKGD